MKTYSRAMMSLATLALMADAPPPVGVVERAKRINAAKRNPNTLTSKEWKKRKKKIKAARKSKRANR